jgi:hypothetical protein
MPIFPIPEDRKEWLAMRRKIAERLNEGSIPEPNSGCLLWLKAMNHDGYGVTWAEGKTALAYNVAYELKCGPVPEGLELDHLCRVRLCINPNHLEPVTRSVNQKRGLSFPPRAAENLSRTHCPKGHPYSGENLRIGPKGNRRCAECSRVKARLRMRRLRECEKRGAA